MTPFNAVITQRTNFSKNYTVYQGPRNLYSKDGKFRPTFKSGAEKHVFSVTPTFHDLMSLNLKGTKLHTFAPIFSKKFPGGNIPDPQNWEASPRLIPSATAHRPTFSQLPRPLQYTLICTLHLTEE